MGVATAASRATGFARTVVLASVLGVGSLSDAYNIANVAPNMVFTLVAGGVLTAAVAPVLARCDDDLADVASVLLGAVTVVGVIASLLLAALAGPVVSVLTAGADPGAEELRDASVAWLRAFAPQVLLYGWSVLAVAVMAARRRLFLGAAAPVLTNLLVVASALLFAGLGGSPRLPVDPGPRDVLGWGTTLAVAAMAIVQLWGARRAAPGLRFTLRLTDPVVRDAAYTGRWLLLYVGANQLGLAAVTALASGVAGGVSAYQWAFAVMQLPYAIIAVSALSAVLPDVARAPSERVRTRALRPAAEAIAWLLAPSAGVMAIAAVPLAVLVVGPADGELVGAAISGFAVSLVPFAAFQLLTRTSYAASDPRSPALVNIVVNLANVAAAAAVLGVGGSDEVVVRGLALAHGLSYVVGAALLGAVAARRRAVRPLRLARHALVPVAITALLTGAAAVVLPPASEMTRPRAAWYVAAVVVVAGAAVVLPLYFGRRGGRGRSSLLWGRRAGQTGQ